MQGIEFLMPGPTKLYATMLNYVIYKSTRDYAAASMTSGSKLAVLFQI